MSSLAYNAYRPLPNKYQEQGLYNGERDSGRTYASSHDSVTEAYSGAAMPQYAKQPASLTRQSSPALSHQSFTSSTSQQRKQSQISQIAPALQIPRDINDSQGSLSELAAQVTCLFWFETSSVLDIAEDPNAELLPIPVLKRETYPSSGFRKWVTTIISTTQVAQNVIVLALLFIYRLKRQNPSVQGKEGSEYRLLTVALMLGNKFLDDNTYTNKTWAEVSGISVAEVHIMEVEFLSNMKYNLFTSKEHWAKWQSQLGRFARFLERASQPATLPMPLYNQISLPSPPTSFQASPPCIPTSAAPLYQYTQQLPPTHMMSANPAPTPQPAHVNPRKRSFEDDDVTQPSKRMMYTQPQSSRSYSQLPPNSMARPFDSIPAVQQYRPMQLPTPREAFPIMSQPARDSPLPRLPPLAQHLVGPSSTPTQWMNMPTSQGQAPSSMAAALQSARSSRNHSPYLSSTNVSPTNTSLLPVNTNSPSFFLRQRDSPYKPVRSVQTLLVPPPSRAMHQPEHVGNNQMHYQPLGRPQERQTGRLPYISQAQWIEQQKAATPIEQWPSFMSSHHQQIQRPQMPQQH